MRSRQRRRGHIEQGQLRDEPSTRSGRALVHAVQARHALALEQSATASLAAIIRCSIRRWDSVCVRARISDDVPVSSKMNSGSSESTATPRCSRLAERGCGDASGRQRLRPRRQCRLLAGEDAVDAVVVEALVERISER